jgi:hypothetical protein
MFMLVYRTLHSLITDPTTELPTVNQWIAQQIIQAVSKIPLNPTKN